jgi:hypothetical protein
MRTWNRPSALPVLLAAGLLAVALPALAQQPRNPCREESSRSDRATHCEVRNVPVTLSGDMLRVDASPNGGIAVHGWNRQEVQAEAKVVATADTEAQARAIAGQVRVLGDGGRVRAEGPRTEDGSGWSVSFDIMVPAQGNLDLQTRNGGVAIDDVEGRVTFRTTNGGISLKNVNGDVRGSTTNGGVSVKLEGAGWRGEGLDVETTNGGVKLTVPDGYAAHLESTTRNGGIHSDIAAAVPAGDERTVNADLGGGGPTIRLRTVNGGLSVSRK